MQQSTQYVLRSVATPKYSPSVGKTRWATFVSYMLLGVFLTLFLGSSPFAAAAVPENKAYSMGYTFLDLCGNADKTTVPAVEAWPGGATNLSNDNRTFLWAEAQGPGEGRRVVTDSNQLTAYEWYGTAGMDRYYGGWDELEGIDACALKDKPLNLGAPFFGFTFIVGNLALDIVSMGLSTSATTNFLIGEDDGVISNIIEGFQDSLYQNYLLPVVMFAGIWLAWQGIVKRRGTEAVQGTGWIVLSAIAAVAFFIWPVEIARTTDNAVGAVGTTVISAMSSATGQEGMCTLPEGAPEREIRTVQCSLWYTFIYQPWAANQFGSIADNTFEPSTNGIQARQTFRPDGPDPSLSLFFLDVRTINYAEVKTGNERSDSYRAQQWEAFANELADERNKEGWLVFAGQKGSDFADGFVALMAMLFGIIPLVFFSITLVMQQVTFILLMLVAPIFLLIGLIPGFGRRLMLGWLEFTASTVVKRIITYVVAGLLLTAIGIISTAKAGSGWGTVGQIVLIAIVGIATVAFRRKILDQYGTVNLGGDQSFLRNDKVEKVLDERNAFQRAKGAVTQPVQGALEARSQGKSAVKGAMSGAVRNVKAVKTGESAARIRDIAATGKQAGQYKFQETIQEKKRELARISRDRKLQATENGWMNKGIMTTSEWKTYSEENGGRAVPRPKNRELANELAAAGIPMRSQVDNALENKARTLGREIEMMEEAGSRSAVNKTQRKQQRADKKAERQEKKAERKVQEAGLAGDDSEAPRQGPRRPNPQDEAAAYRKAEYFKNRNKSS